MSKSNQSVTYHLLKNDAEELPPQVDEEALITEDDSV